MTSNHLTSFIDLLKGFKYVFLCDNMNEVKEFIWLIFCLGSAHHFLLLMNFAQHFELISNLFWIKAAGFSSMFNIRTQEPNLRLSAFVNALHPSNEMCTTTTTTMEEIRPEKNRIREGRTKV